jgi:nicotinamidase-related amidase
MTPAGSAPAALLVIDMIGLLDFPRAARMAPRAVAAARRIQALRRGFHDHDWPVIFVNDNFARWRSDFHEQVAMAVHAGGAPCEIATRLDPGPRDHFVLKPKHSAFLATPLPVLLAKLGVRRLLLTGMALESCVLATAIDANSREFDVAVVRDGVAGLPELAAPTLKVLEGSGTAQVVGSRTALAWAGAGSADTGKIRKNPPR